jgi:hypothetical protein
LTVDAKPSVIESPSVTTATLREEARTSSPERKYHDCVVVTVGNTAAGEVAGTGDVGVLSAQRVEGGVAGRLRQVDGDHHVAQRRDVGLCGADSKLSASVGR